MIIIGNVGQCNYYVFILIDRLLLVDGDIVCFPKNYISTDSKPFANLKYELFIKEMKSIKINKKLIADLGAEYTFELKEKKIK